MAKRRDEARTNFIVGLFVVGLGGVLLVSLFIIATSEGLLKSKSTITADFRTIAGLNDSSTVQLAGREIGKVVAFEFTERQYGCYPETEDFGRKGEGRSDDCEPSLFCVAASGGGLCAELEPYAGDAVSYETCETDAQCSASSICVDKRFRSRYQRLAWSGLEGICVPYKTDHGRITVTMEVDADKMEYIRTDSRATIQSNGVLGDKLVNITVGYATQIRAGGRVQSSPSLVEEMELFKEQLYSISGKVEKSLAGVEGLFDDLNNENSKKDLRGVLANLNTISRQVTEGDGIVAALLQERGMRDDLARTLTSIRDSARGVESTIQSVAQDVPPALSSVRTAADEASALMLSVRDPKNTALAARIFHDEKLGGDVSQAVQDATAAIRDVRETVDEVDLIVAEVGDSVRHGTGTLGKLIKDPKAYDDLVKLLGNIERMNVVKKLVRYVIERDEAASAAKPKVSQ